MSPGLEYMIIDFVALLSSVHEDLSATKVILLLLQGRKLLIIGTTSRREVLEEMGMLSCFSAVVHVSCLSTCQHLINALEDLSIFSQEDLVQIEKSVGERR